MSESSKKTSNKIKKASVLIQYITDEITNCEEIVRFLYFNTKTPLSAKGIDYNNKIIDQTKIPNSESLIGKYIFDTGFNPEVASKTLSTLYINLVSGRFDGLNTNNLKFDINIIIPESFMRITGGYRNLEIAQVINNLFEGEKINPKSEYYDLLGSLKIELESLDNGRLSKTDNSTWTSLGFKVEILSAKFRS